VRQSLLYFIAAALFAIATGLNLYNQGVNIKTGIGAVFIAMLVTFGAKCRREGR
jgi:hypothetical protein